MASPVVPWNEDQLYLVIFNSAGGIFFSSNWSGSADGHTADHERQPASALMACESGASRLWRNPK